MLRGAVLSTRKSNTTSAGKSFDRITIAQVWLQARAVRGQDPTAIRADASGAWIAFAQYGKRSPLGWEIDHRRPVAHGGGDELGNLQALHWANNRSKGDDWPEWQSAIQTQRELADKELLVLRAMRRFPSPQTAPKIGDDHGIV
jgi:hypothetical protein